MLYLAFLKIPGTFQLACLIRPSVSITAVVSRPACFEASGGMRCLAVMLGFVLMFGGPVASETRADVFLDLSGVTVSSAGVQGGFAGSLGGVGVTGIVTGSDIDNFKINAVSGSFDGSVIAGTSPQFHYSNIFSPATATTDKVGYTFKNGGTLTPHLRIDFASPVHNLTFHVANLDSMTYTFGSSGGGLTGLSLLSGNGGIDGDGLKVEGLSIRDGNRSTILAQQPGVQPLLSGDRSAYGSVRLQGVISYLEIDLSRLVSGDGGSFTLSSSVTAVPEPSVVGLFGFAAVMGGIWVHRRSRKAAVSVGNTKRETGRQVG